MAINEIRTDTIFSGSAIFTGTTTLPDSVIASAAKVVAGTLSADRMRDVRRCTDVELFGPATTITALTKTLHIVRGGTGALVGAEAVIYVIASDVSRTVTVDIQKSTAGGAFATVCSVTIGFSTSTPVRVPVAATFSSTALTDGDVLEAIVTVAGGSGTQAQGLHLTLTFDEYNT